MQCIGKGENTFSLSYALHKRRKKESGYMVQPSTYRNSAYNITETALDANTILDYNGVVRACDKILSVSKDGMDRIAGNIERVQLGKEVLCVQDSSLEPLVDEVEQFLKSLPDQGIAPALEDIKQMALEVHDQIQSTENEKASARYNQRVQQASAQAQQSNN